MRCGATRSGASGKYLGKALILGSGVASEGRQSGGVRLDDVAGLEPKGDLGGPALAVGVVDIDDRPLDDERQGPAVAELGREGDRQLQAGAQGDGARQRKEGALVAHERKRRLLAEEGAVRVRSLDVHGQGELEAPLGGAAPERPGLPGGPAQHSDFLFLRNWRTQVRIPGAAGQSPLRMKPRGIFPAPSRLAPRPRSLTIPDPAARIVKCSNTRR